MLGPIVNAIGIIIGGLVGMLLKKGIPEKVTETMMMGMGLCALLIGIQGALEGEKTLVMILSICIGGAIGTLLDLDGWLQKLSDWVETKFGGKDGKKGSVAQGFMAGSMLFGIGAMATVGSLQAGISHDYTMLYTKTLMDMISAFAMSASLGLGVALSSMFVLAGEGAIVLLSGVIAPVLTDVVVTEMSATGSLIIMAIGFNLMSITKIKCANFLPALLLPPILCLFM